MSIINKKAIKAIKNMPLNDRMLLFGNTCMAIGVIGFIITIGILIATYFGIIQFCIYIFVSLAACGYIICEIASERKYKKKLYEQN